VLRVVLGLLTHVGGQQINELAGALDVQLNVEVVLVEAAHRLVRQERRVGAQFLGKPALIVAVLEALELRGRLECGEVV